MVWLRIAKPQAEELLFSAKHRRTNIVGNSKNILMSTEAPQKVLQRTRLAIHRPAKDFRRPESITAPISAIGFVLVTALLIGLSWRAFDS